MRARVSGCSGVMGFKVAMSLRPEREKVHPARPGVGPKPRTAIRSACGSARGHGPEGVGSFVYEVQSSITKESAQQ